MTRIVKFYKKTKKAQIKQIKNGENCQLSAADIKVFDKISEQIDVFDFISATEILEEWGGRQSE